jgi:broad specificity phosphatase PhoE
MGNTSTFYIVRHGETEHNINGIAQGHTDSPLTPDGIKQAESLALIFKNINFDSVFSSDLPRANKTAHIITSNKYPDIETSELLRERNYGVYDEGPSRLFKEENIEMFELLKTLPRLEKRKIKFAPSIESDEEIINRLITFLKQTVTVNENKTILIVTHGGIMRAFLNHLDWNGEEDLRAGAIQNTGYIKLKTDGNSFVIEDVVGVER